MPFTCKGFDLQVILFDLDGTLIDSTEAIIGGFAAAFERHDCPGPLHEEVCALIGHPLDVMFSHLGVESENVQAYVRAYKEHYRVVSKPKTTLLPTAKEALALARSFATLGVVTTKTSQYSRELLEHMEVMHYFDVLIGREDVTHPKPHPEPVLKALSALNAPKETSWMIGDTCMDMVAAKEAGIRGVAVTCGYGALSHLEKCTLHVTNSPIKAVEKILKLSKNDTIRNVS